MSPKIIKYLAIATIFLLSTGAVASQTYLNAYSQPNVTVQDKNHGAWKHRAIDEGDIVTISVESAKNDIDGVNDYVKANLDLGKSHFAVRNRVANVIVAFKKPMSETNVKTLLGSDISNVTQYQIRVNNLSGGLPIEIGGAPSAGVFLPTDMMDVMMKSIEGSIGKASVSGFIWVEMSVNELLYNKLIKSDDVLVVDLTATAALDDFKREASFVTQLKRTYAHSAAPAVYGAYEKAQMGK